MPAQKAENGVYCIHTPVPLSCSSNTATQVSPLHDIFLTVKLSVTYRKTQLHAHVCVCVFLHIIYTYLVTFYHTTCLFPYDQS